MARLSLLLLAVLVLAVAACAHAHAHGHAKLKHPNTVHGRVYCDTCACGFETNITTYIPNAVVRIDCMSRQDGKVMFSAEGVTNHRGAYAIKVDFDHGDHMCDAVLVSSPWKGCSTPDKGRSHARVILTDLNGVASHYRHANNLGFLIDHPLPACKRLLDHYLHSDDE